ncbi:helix-turn-helix domain-containing protein [Pseudarthrobacter sp. J75]|uniref:AraC-like ligand-binding domain-containing protein n=1 Tax=unclassified Pseudarthrobacter TaxID=2647000 RepID=UPI002E805E35|nr:MULTISPECIES: helix-turn-helix domain-containing protein [unclassified Pseudarthrobacter]MEE2524119.1 helix-turn-helix domain-containing protein [Pseudarthrobacter sp. J47]MEE2530398.1 helix-turn-helix domain-containing protein [Pseudarthrobacter sp. J75]MEE2568830.1 helix-turn-helix domain-containing protein [Pseudarthrobacter sp. J64]
MPTPAKSQAPTAPQALRSHVATSFDHWRHLVAESFVPLETQTSDVDGFSGRMRSRVLDRMSIVEVTATSHEVHRTPALIARSNERYFKLNLQLEGTGLLIQDNREAILRPGDLAIYDTNRPYTLTFEEQARMMVVMFPCDALALPTDYVGQLAAVRMAGSTGLSGIVGQFISQLAGNMEVLSGPSGSRLAANALDLVSTLLHAEMDLTPDRMKPQALLAVSIREYIEANLADPLLSPASIAAAHFISTRHLHNVFHESGTTVASWIRSQRLDGARRDLRDPLHAAHSVGAVAARWGFLDAAHFSRTFRDAFGVTPSDWRRSG